MRSRSNEPRKAFGTVNVTWRCGTSSKALRVSEGDAVYLTETPDGFQLVAHDPDFEEQMRVAEDFMRRYRNTLRELAK